MVCRANNQPCGLDDVPFECHRLSQELGELKLPDEEWDCTTIFNDMLCGVVSTTRTKASFLKPFKTMMGKSPFFQGDADISVRELGTIITPAGGKYLGLGQKNLRDNYLSELTCRIVSPFYNKYSQNDALENEPLFCDRGLAFLKSINDFIHKMWHEVASHGPDRKIGRDGVEAMQALLLKLPSVESGRDCNLGWDIQPICKPKCQQQCKKLLSKITTGMGDSWAQTKM